MSLDNEMDQMVRGNEKATLRAEVARLTAELAAAKRERDALAAKLVRFGWHQPYCYEAKTATEKGFVAPPYRHCTCEFSKAFSVTAAILATVRAKARAKALNFLVARAESVETMYREAGDWDAQEKWLGFLRWLNEQLRLADAEEVGSAPKT